MLGHQLITLKTDKSWESTVLLCQENWIVDEGVFFFIEES